MRLLLKMVSPILKPFWTIGQHTTASMRRKISTTPFKARLRHALQMSLNLPAVELLAEIGPDYFIARLRNAGARITLPDEAAPGLAIGLGGLGITLRDLAALFAGLARGGDG